MDNVQTQAVTKLHQTKPAITIPLVMPVTSNDKIMEAWNNFNELKLKLLEDKDFVEIQGKQFAKKSTFRKLALAFGISTEIIKEERRDFKNGFGYEITMKAIAPSGRFMTAMASCHSNEKKFSKDSDVRAIAQTRSTNRCIADLIGWSAPSAEEITSSYPSEEPAKENVINQEYMDNVYQDSDSSQVEMTDRDEYAMTEKQRGLIISLINQKIYEPVEREKRLEAIDCYNKGDASEIISELLGQ